jgi:N-acetylglucosaminyl-diphospho-decaprenol L-rhamnosyltransferase
MLEDPLATVIVVTWQGAHLLPPCLDALARQQGPRSAHVVWVVDNASTDGTDRLLAERYPQVRVLVNARNEGFGGGCNRALREVATPYAVLLNNDARPEPGWLDALMATFEEPEAADIGAVTAKVLLSGADRVVNNAGNVVRTDGYAYDRGYGETDGPPYDEPADVFGFCGAAAALRMAALRDVGLFAADFFLYYEDTDLSWRLQLAGWRVRYQPAAAVSHLHSASTDQRSALFAFCNERNRLVMLVRNAPARMALAQVLRFPVTTALLTARRSRRRPAVEQHFRLQLRLTVLASFLRLLPTSLAERRRIGRRTRVSRALVAATLAPAPPVWRRPQSPA